MRDNMGYVLALAVIALKLFLDVELVAMRAGWPIDAAGLLMVSLGVYLLVGFFLELRNPSGTSDR